MPQWKLRDGIPLPNAIDLLDMPVVLDSCAGLLAAPSPIHQPLVPLWAMELAADLFLGTWLFAVGASVGSFLNVVVYRLPRGLNLVHPPSRCPSCLHPIRLRDNVPIFGWLLLGGKCRDCQAPVSSRYLWIELLMGSAFLTAWLVDAHWSQLFAPLDRAQFRAIPSAASIPFWCAYALHVGLIATLLAGALIHADGFRTPFRLFVPILVLGLALPIAWPVIRQVAAFRYAQPGDWQAGLIDGAAGIVAGAALALVGSLRWLVFGRGWPRFAPVGILTSVGVVVGWQWMLLLTPAVVVLYLSASAALWLLGPLPDLPAESPRAADSIDPNALPETPDESGGLHSNDEAPPTSSESPSPALPVDPSP